METGRRTPVRSASEDSPPRKRTTPSLEIDDLSDHNLTSSSSSNIGRRRSSLQQDEYYSSAAKRLQQAISNLANEGHCSADVVLHSILEEVSKEDQPEQLKPEDLIQKVQTKLEPLGESSPKKSISGENYNFENLLDEIEDDEKILEYEKSAQSGLAKIAQLVAFGSLDLEDVGDIIDQTSVKNSFESVIDYILTKLKEEWGYFFDVLVPLKQIHTMLFIGLFQIISVSQVFQTLPIVASYVSFFGMVYYTLKMFRCRRSIRKLVVWKRLFTIFAKKSTNVDEDDDEKVAETSHPKLAENSLYNWSSLEPYANYFLVLISFVFFFAWSGHNLPNVLSLCGISLFFTLLCFVALPDHFDSFTLLALILDTLSSLPLILTQLGVISNSSIFVRDFHKWNIGLISVNLNLSSIIFLCLLLSFLTVFFTYAKLDFYQIVIPHTVCLLWWHVTLMLFTFARFHVEWTNIVLTAGLIWLILFPTTLALTVVGAAIFSQLNIRVNFADMVKCVVTLFIVLLPLLYKKFTKMADSSTLIRGRKSFLLFAVYFFLVFFCAAVMYNGSVHVTSSDVSSDLTWSEFDKYCAGGEETFDNRLQQQMMCTDLMGVVVAWKGAVQSVKVIKVENFMEYMLGYCPNFIAEWLRCFYGVSVNETNKFFKLAKRNCSTSRHNVYTFQIETSGPWGQKMISSAKSTILLSASDRFKETLKLLREGDVIAFTAMFDNYLLKYPAKLRLLSVRCVSCRNVPTTPSDNQPGAISRRKTFWKKIFEAFQYLFNFVFHPLFTIS